MTKRGADAAMARLACPRCFGRLEAAAHLLRCAACGPYPVLGGVPVLVPDPSAWCADFHDAALAALAQHGEATREAVAVVEAFAEARRPEPRAFSDDWTPAEHEGAAAPALVKGPAARALDGLLRAGREEGPAAWLARHAASARVALEVGCGAGERSEALARTAAALVVGDSSLRAVLQARARAARGDAEVTGVVLDAAALPLRPRSVDLVVAEHLVDLLDAPADFFARARQVLRPGGRLLVTTPEPALGFGDDGAAEGLAARAGFRVTERRDGLPWLRVNSSRFVECYLVQALALRRDVRGGGGDTHRTPRDSRRRGAAE